VLTLVACRDRNPPPASSSPLETAIARELTAKLAQPVTATCTMIVGLPAKCEATAADGMKLPIEITSEGSEWAWRVPGRLIETAPIKAYVDRALADLQLAQQANCGGRFAFVVPGDRVGCKLSGGGIAFVQLAADGTASLELALDPASGAARGDLVTPERDRQLTTISRALETLEGESATDGEEEVGSAAGDAGVAAPAVIEKP
jgi:hypothetical protein